MINFMCNQCWDTGNIGRKYWLFGPLVTCPECKGDPDAYFSAKHPRPDMIIPGMSAPAPPPKTGGALSYKIALWRAGCPCGCDCCRELDAALRRMQIDAMKPSDKGTP